MPSLTSSITVFRERVRAACAGRPQFQLGLNHGVSTRLENFAETPAEAARKIENLRRTEQKIIVRDQIEFIIERPKTMNVVGLT